MAKHISFSPGVADFFFGIGRSRKNGPSKNAMTKEHARKLLIPYMTFIRLLTLEPWYYCHNVGTCLFFSNIGRKKIWFDFYDAGLNYKSFSSSEKPVGKSVTWNRPLEKKSWYQWKCQSDFFPSKTQYISDWYLLCLYYVLYWSLFKYVGNQRA